MNFYKPDGIHWKFWPMLLTDNLSYLEAGNLYTLYADEYKPQPDYKIQANTMQKKKNYFKTLCRQVNINHDVN